MRALIRALLPAVVLAGASAAQSMTDAAAMAAGSTVGGAAGKQVSSGIDKIFGKAGGVLGDAAKQGGKEAQAAAKEPILKTGPGKPAQRGNQPGAQSYGAQPYNVPPPPRPSGERRVSRRAPAAARASAAPVQLAPQVLPEPRPAQVTRADLAAFTSGMPRADVLRAGAPSSRVTMFDGGHLVEIYRYQSQGSIIGTVRLSDGAISDVSVTP